MGKRSQAVNCLATFIPVPCGTVCRKVTHQSILTYSTRLRLACIELAEMLRAGLSLLIETKRDQKIDGVLQAFILQLRPAGLAGFLLFKSIEFRVSAVDQSRFV